MKICLVVLLLAAIATDAQLYGYGPVLVEGNDDSGEYEYPMDDSSVKLFDRTGRSEGTCHGGYGGGGGGWGWGQGGAGEFVVGGGGGGGGGHGWSVLSLAAIAADAQYYGYGPVFVEGYDDSGEYDYPIDDFSVKLLGSSGKCHGRGGGGGGGWGWGWHQPKHQEYKKIGWEYGGGDSHGWGWELERLSIKLSGTGGHQSKLFELGHGGGHGGLGWQSIILISFISSKY